MVMVPLVSNMVVNVTVVIGQIMSMQIRSNFLRCNVLPVPAPAIQKVAVVVP